MQSRTTGYEIAAKRLEETVEAVRAAMGNDSADWPGLSHLARKGVQHTQEFAQRVAHSQMSEHDQNLINLFILRQLEISLALISRLSKEVHELTDQLEKTQKL